MPLMTHKFDDLPRSIRERIVELSNAPETDPRIVSRIPRRNQYWFKYFMALCGLVIIGVTVQFVVERHDIGIGPHSDIEVYAMMAGGIWLMVMSVISVVFGRLYPPAPYRRGSFALRSYLMKLERAEVTLQPVAELGKPTIVTMLRNGRYTGTRLDLAPGFSFHYGPKKVAEDALIGILNARERLKAILAAKDTRALVAIDPFHECTISGNWSGGQALTNMDGPKSPLVSWSARTVQLVISVVLGLIGAYALYMHFLAHRLPRKF